MRQQQCSTSAELLISFLPSISEEFFFYVLLPFPSLSFSCTDWNSLFGQSMAVLSGEAGARTENCAVLLEHERWDETD